MFCLFVTPVTAKEILLDDFADGFAPGWKEKSFHGKTEYSIIRENEMTVVRAVSMGTASGYFYTIDFDPNEYPILTWSWKVDNILAKGDATRKDGDDYPARIYVVFPSFFFWKTRALNYVWANRLPRESFIPNPYTANAVMVAVESGTEHVGVWKFEQRDIVDDYIKAFGSPPGRVGAIAIMTDSDDTRESATAYYGPIRILSLDDNQKKPPGK